MNEGYAVPYSVAAATPSARAEFIRKTYFHVAYALLALVGIESLLIKSSFAESLIKTMISGYAWFGVFALYLAASWLAEKWAHSDTSRAVQYMGLGLYVVAISFVFLPVCYIAKNFYPEGILTQAAIITGLLFVSLTVIAFTTKKDFSFLRGVLVISFFVALGIMAAAFFFEFNFGLIFSGFMILVMGCSILYHTSQIMFHYRTEQHVAASLGLFASLATLFYYVLSFLMSLAGNE